MHRREDPRGHQKRVEDPAEPEVDDARFILPHVVVLGAGSCPRAFPFTPRTSSTRALFTQSYA